MQIILSQVKLNNASYFVHSRVFIYKSGEIMKESREIIFTVFTLSEIQSVVELLPRRRKVSAYQIPASLADKGPSSDAPSAGKEMEAGAGIVRAGSADFRLANEPVDVAGKLLRGRNQHLRISLLLE